MRRRLTWMGWMGWMLVSCAPELSDIKQRSEVPQPEQHEIVPVGGYEPMAGTWDTLRKDGVAGEKRVPLVIEVDRDVLTGSHPEHALRMRCQASHRTCTGTWSDNLGHGTMVWNFDTEFRSFTGSYDGTSNGQDLAKTRWTGSKQSQ